MTAQPSTVEGAKDSLLSFVARYFNNHIRRLSYYSNYKKKKLDNIICCKHNFIDCPHHPYRWEVRQLAKGGTRFRPIYYNSEPGPYLWYEMEDWP
jgi:hypothetical protein